jgi:hypothetical protein
VFCNPIQSNLRYRLQPENVQVTHPIRLVTHFVRLLLNRHPTLGTLPGRPPFLAAIVLKPEALVMPLDAQAFEYTFQRHIKQLTVLLIRLLIPFQVAPCRKFCLEGTVKLGV